MFLPCFDVEQSDKSKIFGTNRPKKLQRPRRVLTSVHVVGSCNFRINFVVISANSNHSSRIKGPRCLMISAKKDDILTSVLRRHFAVALVSVGGRSDNHQLFSEKWKKSCIYTSTEFHFTEDSMLFIASWKVVRAVLDQMT